MSDAFYWLALVCGFVACMVVPAAVAEWYGRSEYRKYLAYQRALEGQRDDYVPPVRSTPEHPRTILRHGIVK